MLLLVSGSTRTVRALARSAPQLGALLAPANRNSVASVVALGLPWAVDNGAYSGFDADRFRRLLGRCEGKPRLLWVVCPDVVADARATLALFGVWREELASHGLPVAFVGQDGAEDLEVPWDLFDAWFVGGSTRWKLSQASADLCREAKARGKHVHMGRVNSFKRMRTAHSFGCDSVDGSSLSMFGDKYIHRFAAWSAALEREAACQPALFD